MIRKNLTSYTVEHDNHTMKYNVFGVYIGQWQPNVLDDYSGEIFLCAEEINGVPCVNGSPVPPLTDDEMRSAE